jgi:hypothetical protein
MLGMVDSITSETSWDSLWVRQLRQEVVCIADTFPVTGSLKLANVPILNLVGGGQFRKGKHTASFWWKACSMRHTSLHRGYHRIGRYRMDHLLDTGRAGERGRVWCQEIVRQPL